MKHKDHTKRKSFKKWGLKGQLTQSFTPIQHVLKTIPVNSKGQFGENLRKLRIMPVWVKGIK